MTTRMVLLSCMKPGQRVVSGHLSTFIPSVFYSRMNSNDSALFTSTALITHSAVVSELQSLEHFLALSLIKRNRKSNTLSQIKKVAYECIDMLDNQETTPTLFNVINIVSAIVLFC